MGNRSSQHDSANTGASQRQQEQRQEPPGEQQQPPRPSYWQMAKDGYDELVNAIIRPPRADYDARELGPKTFSVRNRRFKRTDFELQNKMFLKIQCSHWEPYERTEAQAQLPCVVYLHGNSSCRCEALEYVETVLSLGVTLLSVDFAGCGQSEGQYISLGYFEQDDVATIVEHLRQLGTVSTIALWGRSMGAATALMFGHRDLTIAGMVLDSPFSNLSVLCKELSSKVNITIPGFMVSGALSLIRSTIKNRAGFDIYKVSPIENVDTCFIPAVFTAADDDDFILPSHTQAIHDKYAGDKNLMMVPGDHNTRRPQYFQDSVSIFLFSRLCQPMGVDSSTLNNSLLPSASMGALGLGSDGQAGSVSARAANAGGSSSTQLDWGCPACTFINQHPSVCVMCHTDRPAQNTAVSASSVVLNGGGDKKEMGEDKD
jgi:pimeloyl-ACP methyl ester carboxylesterase